jgi:hypothetical protein
MLPVHRFLLLVFAGPLTIAAHVRAQAPLVVTRQGSAIHFEAWRFEEGAGGSYAPLVDMKTVAFYSPIPPATTPFFQTQWTDGFGNLAIPPNYEPTQILVAGPESHEVRVFEWRENSATPGTYTQGNPLTTVRFLGGQILLEPHMFGGLTAGHLNAFLHAHEASLELESYFTSAPEVIQVGFWPVYSTEIAAFLHAETELRIYCPPRAYALGIAPDTDAVGAPKHATVIAHELAHFHLARVWPALATNPFDVGPMRRFSEALSDFYASVVAGTAIIGANLSGASLPRHLTSGVRYPPDPSTNVYHQSLILSGALHDTRRAFLPGSGASPVELRIPQVLATHPQDERDFLVELLRLDDIDGNLANGTPHAWQYWFGFEREHSIPWPTGVARPYIVRLWRAPGRNPLNPVQ